VPAAGDTGAGYEEGSFVGVESAFFMLEANASRDVPAVSFNNNAPSLWHVSIGAAARAVERAGVLYDKQVRDLLDRTDFCQ
jgi:hypothetical protein